jgi:hypothetical protein
MKNSILIIGPAQSGKSTKARKIATQFQIEEVVKIDCFHKNVWDNKFLFRNCTENTKLIIFEELKGWQQLQNCMGFINNPITVNKPLISQFTIEPKLIFVCEAEENELLQLLDSEYFPKIEVIKLKGRKSKNEIAQVNLVINGTISQPMGVNTKPAHKLEVNGYWVDVDPNAPEGLVGKIKNAIMAFDSETISNAEKVRCIKNLRTESGEIAFISGGIYELTAKKPYYVFKKSEISKEPFGHVVFLDEFKKHFKELNNE